MSVALLAPVASLLRQRPEEFRNIVHEQLFARHPQARHVFGVTASRGHAELAPALAWALERAGEGPRINDDVLARMRRLGLAHRRHGFPIDLYEDFAAIVTQSLAELNSSCGAQLSDDSLHRAAEVTEALCRAMAASAHTADMSGIAPAYAAMVTQVQRVSASTSIVRARVQSGPEISPGQAVPVSASYASGLWRPLVPATPVNPAGDMEFHVTNVEGGQASGLFAAARVGDQWTLGAPLQPVEFPHCSRLGLLSFGTGLAAAESLIFSCLDNLSRPSVHLTMVADSPSELYDLDRMQRLARNARWFDVSPISHSEQDQWWVPRSGRPRLHARDVNAEVGDASLACERVMSQAPEAVVIAGPDDAVTQARSCLTQLGLPEDAMRIVSFQRHGRWPALNED
ncbi:FAD-binding oxidoreductase [Corynebacterium tapiri]|uniref:FAD-binding FR-type domain-containing protein n=1 Tax=Corynebacterium tapiri TaxID=1448266 RepID=A0A5C4U2U6_9CORY|nr:FAD-binding oxidoreductase [Corynebacterium tapiri]TNL95720.1 hypothetical protein FHE74_08980 [Corynebacterium tapiri]